MKGNNVTSADTMESYLGCAEYTAHAAYKHTVLEHRKFIKSLSISHMAQANQAPPSAEEETHDQTNGLKVSS